MGKGQWGEDSNARFVKYSACSVARQDSGARQRNWLGGWDRCRAGLSTGGGVLPYRQHQRYRLTQYHHAHHCRTAFARLSISAKE